MTAWSRRNRAAGESWRLFYGVIPWNSIACSTIIQYCLLLVKAKHRITLESIFAHPVSGSVRWKDIEALFLALGAEIRQGEGSRVAVILFDEVQVFHRPHPRPETDKGARASIRKWLQKHGVEP